MHEAVKTWSLLNWTSRHTTAARYRVATVGQVDRYAHTHWGDTKFMGDENYLLLYAFH